MMENLSQTLDRSPAVAGQFYPANPARLQEDLTALFAEAAPRQNQQVRAIISPHAGYVYSGQVAASAFNQIDGKKSYKRIFILASSHQEHFEGASVYCDGDFVMPYGKVLVDTAFGKRLVDSFPELFTANRSPHLREHSLEVQLPFLHHIMQTDYSIIPIVLGTFDPAVCKEIARVLKHWFNRENLFVISTDFSHYPSYKDARMIDDLTKTAILSNDPGTLLNALAENARKQVPNLATSLCGWTSVLTLLYMTTGNEAMKYHAIAYQNSGDAPRLGEKNQVVGYWAISVSESEQTKEKNFDENNGTSKP